MTPLSTQSSLTPPCSGPLGGINMQRRVDSQRSGTVDANKGSSGVQLWVAGNVDTKSEWTRTSTSEVAREREGRHHISSSMERCPIASDDDTKNVVKFQRGTLARFSDRSYCDVPMSHLNSRLALSHSSFSYFSSLAVFLSHLSICLGLQSKACAPKTKQITTVVTAMAPRCYNQRFTSFSLFSSLRFSYLFSFGSLAPFLPPPLSPSLFLSLSLFLFLLLLLPPLYHFLFLCFFSRFF